MNTNKKLRIAFVTYNTLFQRIGGLQEQIKQTRNELLKKGHFVTLFKDLDDTLTDFDLVHVFGLNHANYVWITESLRNNIPVVISPLVRPNWSWLDKIKIKISNTISSQLLAGIPGKGIFSSFEYSRQALFSASAILVQSDKEQSTIQSIFNLEHHPHFHKVQNGLNLAYKAPFTSEKIEKNYIFVPGSIYSHKNQVLLADKTKSVGITLKYAGDILDQKYFQQLTSNKYKHVEYVGVFSSASPELISLYENAKLTILYSKSETFGLVAIESLARGTPVVMTNKTGLNTESLAPYLLSVEPGDTAQLVKAIDTLKDVKIDSEFIERIQKEYSWEKIAHQIEAIYLNILQSND